ncbi:hypothetical protein N7478_002972 [Penicillium angulare]|uniref:uncharacterized protein n=1 Tax=Penicillium angulare TaxID=116970 RepID=UPI00253F9D83|nr:uncharacterized protein N7478_002972 [Penicillium angulare]KAJ5287286.1 hypothetical protein N7478_002972 [Penicillium angulare]
MSSCGWAVGPIQSPECPMLEQRYADNLLLRRRCSFACAVKKLISSSQLIGNDETDTYLCIWNGIENDFVLSAACLPSIPPVCRFVRSFVKTRVLGMPASKAGSKGSEYVTFGSEFSSRHSERNSGRHSDARDSIVGFESML